MITIDIEQHDINRVELCNFEYDRLLDLCTYLLCKDPNGTNADIFESETYKYYIQQLIKARQALVAERSRILNKYLEQVKWSDCFIDYKNSVLSYSV